MNDNQNRIRLVAGVFVLCGLVFLAGLVLEFGSLRHKLRKPYRVSVTFMDAQNLIKGAPVVRAGAVIGQVATSPELVEGMAGVKVDLEIYPEYKIPKNSPLRVTPVGLMGDSKIDVGMPPEPTGEFLRPGDTVAGESSMDLQSTANRITDEVMVVIGDLRNSMAELNVTVRKLNDGVLSDENLKNLADALKSMSAAVAKVDQEVLSDENTRSLKESIAKLRETLETVNLASQRAHSSMEKIDKAMDSLGPSLKGVQAAGNSLENASKALRGLLTDAREGDGLMNALLHDRELRENFTALVSNLRRKGLIFYRDKPGEEESRRSPESSRSSRLKPYGNR